MTKLTLSKAQEQLLHDQVIDADQPGPVRRDFQTLLDFVGPQGVKAAGKYNLLPIDAIGELDERLSRPLRLLQKMKRPQLRSHPYLQGLHLLLRASGLSRVEGTGSKARLVVDPVVHDRWQQLNPTEQYFTLLEAWLRVGRGEMVGEQQRSVFGGFLMPCLQTWREIPAKGKRFNLERPQEVFFFGIWREFYQLALMGLFGLMEIEHPRSAVQPWVPAGVRHVPFGDALLTLLAVRFPAPWRPILEDNDDSEDEPTGTVHFGEWQPLFQPYFPEWRENLVLPQAEAREGTFVFRVSLGRVWRRIAMPADATLDDLVSWILDSVDFDRDHLYEFTYRDRFGAACHALHPYSDEGPWADEVSIGELPLEPGQSMQLTYDFGDNWPFDVKLERIEPPATKIKAPRILESHGQAPEQYPEWD